MYFPWNFKAKFIKPTFWYSVPSSHPILHKKSAHFLILPQRHCIINEFYILEDRIVMETWGYCDTRSYLFTGSANCHFGRDVLWIILKDGEPDGLKQGATCEGHFLLEHWPDFWFMNMALDPVQGSKLLAILCSWLKRYEEMKVCQDLHHH